MGKPRPFSRPAVVLASHGKAWRDVSVYSVQEGDMVKDHGLVKIVVDSPSGVKIQFASGYSVFFSEGDIVHAFVKA